MSAGGILPVDRTSYDLLERVAHTVVSHEVRWVSPHEARALAGRFAKHMHLGRVMLGTPALTNIWSGDRPLASCAAVPSQHYPTSERDHLAIAEQYYLDNMGSGYNMDEFRQPIEALVELNDHAASVERSGACERYVGNMAHMSAGHPSVRDFIMLKLTSSLPHFNLSINFGAEQLAALFAGDSAMDQVVDEISYAAWRCGDPGVMCLDRFNLDNPLRAHSLYTTTAPCAEVGLAPGDTCLFGYVNLAAFANSTALEGYDLAALRETVSLTIRVLDDVHEADERYLANPLSRVLASAKRRIGLSVCGYADLLLWLGFEYGSPQAIALLEDLLSIVRFEAIRTSLALAQQRGPFPSFRVSEWAAGKHRLPPPTRLVNRDDWRELYQAVRFHGLRHSSLTALPPSGRSSILLGVSPSIEPFLTDPGISALNPALRDHASRQPPSLLRTATELDWRAHLGVVKAAASLVDESVSKTINLSPATTVDEVKDVFIGFLQADVKALSVYRLPV